jgi:hypothetical protein
MFVAWDVLILRNLVCFSATSSSWRLRIPARITKVEGFSMLVGELIKFGVG